jgi:hypothetical protein
MRRRREEDDVRSSGDCSSIYVAAASVRPFSDTTTRLPRTNFSHNIVKTGQRSRTGKMSVGLGLEMDLQGVVEEEERVREV